MPAPVRAGKASLHRQRSPGRQPCFPQGRVGGAVYSTAPHPTHEPAQGGGALSGAGGRGDCQCPCLAAGRGACLPSVPQWDWMLRTWRGGKAEDFFWALGWTLLTAPGQALSSCLTEGKLRHGRPSSQRQERIRPRAPAVSMLPGPASRPLHPQATGVKRGRALCAGGRPACRLLPNLCTPWGESLLPAPEGQLRAQLPQSTDRSLSTRPLAWLVPLPGASSMSPLLVSIKW